MCYLGEIREKLSENALKFSQYGDQIQKGISSIFGQLILWNPTFNEQIR